MCFYDQEQGFRNNENNRMIKKRFSKFQIQMIFR